MRLYIDEAARREGRDFIDQDHIVVELSPYSNMVLEGDVPTLMARFAYTLVLGDSRFSGAEAVFESGQQTGEESE